jgi:hypothetical protein
LRSAREVLGMFSRDRSISELEKGKTMNQYRPICVVLALGMLGSGSYMLYDASSNPLPGATMGLIGGAVFWSLGAFMAFFSWKGTHR